MGALPTFASDSVRPVTTDLVPRAPGAELQLVVRSGPAAGTLKRRDMRRLARGLGLRSTELKRLLAVLPATLAPQASTLKAATDRLSELSRLGFSVDLEPKSEVLEQCKRHPGVCSTRVCACCNAQACPLCVTPHPAGFYCRRCGARTGFKRGFFLVRLSVLLTLLILVGLWGYGDAQSRSARTDWRRTLSVAFVVVTEAEVEPAYLEQLTTRLRALEDQLAEEFSRYRKGPRPFRFILHGPAHASAPPDPPRDAGFTQLALHSYRQWAYLSGIDRSVALDASVYDSRIYLVARPAAREAFQLVEGYGEHGGRVGIVEVELNSQMVDLVLAVAAHELMHTLGAEDKYDASGNALIPAGLAEPNANPRFPQRYVEIMARNRPIAAGRELPLESLTQLAVGPLTAKEIGWSSRP